MTAIKNALLPKDERGNDANDFQKDPGFIGKIEIEKTKTALDNLLSLSATHRISEMEANMKNDVFIFNELALSGQITLFYGWPNTGKTLFFLRFIINAIKENQVKGEDVIYINADDSYKGLFTKAKIAKENGFHMISPAEAGVSHKNILSLLEEISQEDNATGKIIVLDTLKKFADMMSKNAQADLYEVLRRMIARGGTVIIAGHANKHKDCEGNLIYEGTSDTMNDIDCAYSMYRISNADDETQVVEFRREKDRGDVIPKVSYQYTKATGMHYMDMVNSVTRMDSAEAARIEKEKTNQTLKSLYEPEMLFVLGLLRTNGPMNQTSIINALKGDSELAGEITARKLGSALKKLINVSWTAKRGDKNAMIYSLIGSEAVQYRKQSQGE